MFSLFASRRATLSAEFAQRKADRARLDGALSAYLADGSHSPDGIPSRANDRLADTDAHASLIDAAIARDLAKQRDTIRRGHRLYKATARALVEASK